MQSDNANRLRDDLLSVIRTFNERAEGVQPCPTLYLVGAAILLLEGITSRLTGDLDYISDDRARLFQNVITSSGLHSHSVSPGLVSMPRGWRDRCRPATEFETKNIRILVPELTDRLIDKVARGLDTDWEDIEAILANASRRIDAVVLRDRARSVLDDPPSTVFDAQQFHKNFERLRRLAQERGMDIGGL